MNNNSEIEEAFTVNPYYIDYKYEKFKDKLFTVNFRTTEDINIIQRELLFRAIEPLIFKLKKINGSRIDVNNDEQLELICKIETISKCPIIMSNTGGGLYICLDLLRVKPLVLKETYSLRYLYRDNTGLKEIYDDNFFDSIDVIVDEKHDLYNDLNVTLYTAKGDMKPKRSYETVMDNIVLMFKIYDTQIKHTRGNKLVGRGNKDTLWNEDKFFIDNNNIIAYKTAYTKLNIMEPLIEKVIVKKYSKSKYLTYHDFKSNSRKCRTKHIINNFENHVLLKSELNIINQVSIELYATPICQDNFSKILIPS